MNWIVGLTLALQVVAIVFSCATIRVLRQTRRIQANTRRVLADTARLNAETAGMRARQHR